MSVDLGHEFGKIINILSRVTSVAFIAYLIYSLQDYINLSGTTETLFITLLVGLAIMWSSTPIIMIMRIVTGNYRVLAKSIWLILQLACAGITIMYVYDNLNFNQMEIFDYILILAAPTLQYMAIIFISKFANLVN